MSAIISFQHLSSPGIDSARSWLGAVTLVAVVSALALTPYLLKRVRLDTDYKSALLLSESFLPIMKKHDPPQVPNGNQPESESTELTVAIVR